MLNRKNDNAVNLKMLKKTSADFEVGCCTTNSTIAQHHQSVMNKNAVVNPVWVITGQHGTEGSG